MEKPDPESVSGGTLLSTQFDGTPNIGHDPGWRLPWMTAADQGAAGSTTMHRINPAALHPINRRTGVGQSTGGKSLMAATGVDPGFQQQLEQLIAHAPHTIGVNSAWRSNEQQQALHDRAEQQHPGEANRWAAEPGTSWHEFGLAADLAFADPETLQWAHQHAAEYGLFFPMSWEPWHVQPLWTQGRKPSDSADATGGTTAPPDGMSQDQQQAGSTITPTDPIGQIFGTFRSTVHNSDKLGNHPMIGDGLDIASRWANVFSQQHAQTAPIAEGGLGGGLAAAVGGTPTSSTVDFQRAYQYVIDAGGTPEEARMLAAFAGPESGYRIGVVSPVNKDGTYDRGLFQINDVHKKDQQRLVTDPEYNAQVALEIYRSQGPTAWSVYNNGEYKQYLPGGAAGKVTVS